MQNRNYDDTWFAPILMPSVFIIIPYLLISMFTQFNVVYRKYNNNYIIFYNAAIRGYLIINNEIQAIGGAFQNDFYGQLPDGTDVYVKITFSGSVKFAIGSFNNNLMTFM